MLSKVPNVSMEIMNDGDHLFSWNYSRQQLFSVVEKTLVTMAEDPSAS
jgi:hypothetical protein